MRMSGRRCKSIVSLLVPSLLWLGGCGAASTSANLNDPRVHVACRGVIDGACASRAATMSGHLVAWIAVDRSQRDASLIVLDSGHVVERLHLGDAEVSVESPAMKVVTRGAPVHLSWNGGSGTLRVERNPGFDLMSVTWPHRGSHLSLAVIDIHANPTKAPQIAGTVRYATP